MDPICKIRSWVSYPIRGNTGRTGMLSCIEVFFNMCCAKEPFLCLPPLSPERAVHQVKHIHFPVTLLTWQQCHATKSKVTK